ncbi:NAD(P)-dependent oxidoreductase [Streptomyces sp. BBFR2]|uniref:NAD(P)-dependent oxidoreductase n=1 Tax=Streptomyces sp. BBFR2 TaxID=3372854 RepID=UPI0037D9E31C
MENQSRESVSVIGLGMMGRALAGAFLGKGHATTVWNRSAAKADELVGRGALRADSVSAAVAASDVVIVCLSTYEAVHTVLTEAEDDLRGKTLVNLTSGTPAEARETQAWAAERGIAYLGGAIMAIPPMIGLPHALIFYGGEKSLFDRHEETLRALGGRATHLGTDTGVPMIYDVALLGILWSTLAGYLHALALVGTEQVAAKDFLPYATAWVEHVALPSMPGKAEEADRGAYPTEISSLDVNRAAIAHLVEASVTQGISPEVFLPIQALIERRVAQGHGADSLGSLIEAIRNPVD